MSWARRRAAGAVVADDDGVSPGLGGEAGVLGFHDALEDELAAPLLLIQATSAQERRGSNCSLVQEARVGHVADAFDGRRGCRMCGAACPVMPRHQRGLVARLMRLASVGRGGR